MEQYSECTVCGDMKKKQCAGLSIAISDEDLIEVLGTAETRAQKKKLRQEKSRRFAKYVNTLMNEGGGILCLHVENPYMLGIFDQSVDKLMASMIADDTCFGDNFERYVRDKHHVVFRVKIKDRPLSTVTYNTKISHDKGLEDLTPGQMRMFLNSRQREEDEKEIKGRRNRREVYTFFVDEEVKVVAVTEMDEGHREDEIVFQESASVQAKKIAEAQNAGRRVKMSRLVDSLFDENNMTMYLPKYISAFAKQRQGGSVFLGIYEDVEMKEKCEKVSPDEQEPLLSIHKPDFFLWKDSNGDYIVAQENRRQENHTGVFKCQGISLTSTERDDFCNSVKTKIREKMFWYPYKSAEDDIHVDVPGVAAENSPDLPVVIKFLEVYNGPSDLVVIEVKVEYYPGVAFYSKEGPEAYHSPVRGEDSEVQPTRMTKEEWFEKFTAA